MKPGTSVFFCMGVFAMSLAACDDASSPKAADAGMDAAHSCAAPTAPMNGSVQSDGTLAAFSCDAGYVLTGPATATCSSTTVTWSTVPTCEPELALDATTGLEWQLSPPTDALAQNSAAGYCDALTIAGKSDFRLPDARDLFSSVGLPWRIGANVQPDYEWTSTAMVGIPTTFYKAKVAANLDIQSADQTTVAKVRCVRGTPIPGPSLSAPGNGTVIDATTGLVWQQQVDATLRSGADSVTYCSQLALPGGGWRSATAAEYLTIVDYTKASNLDKTMFTNIQAFNAEFRTSVATTTVYLGGNGSGSGRITTWSDPTSLLPCLCVRHP